MAKVDSRTRLIVAAAKAVSRGGESAINVHKVAKEAGVTVPSIYHFFGNRSGLLEEAQVFRFQEGLKIVSRRLDEDLALVTTKRQFKVAIDNWTRTVCGSSNRSYRLLRNSVMVTAINNPRLARRIADLFEDQVKQIAAFLNLARARGWIDEDLNVESIAYWTITQLNGRLMIEIDPKKRFSEEWNEHFRKSVLDALRLS